MDKATLDKMKKYASENSEFTADCNSVLALLDHIERAEAGAAAMRDLFEQAWVKWGQSGVKMSDAALYGECERMLKRLDGKE